MQGCQTSSTFDVAHLDRSAIGIQNTCASHIAQKQNAFIHIQREDFRRCETLALKIKIKRNERLDRACKMHDLRIGFTIVKGGAGGCGVASPSKRY